MTLSVVSRSLALLAFCVLFFSPAQSLADAPATIPVIVDTDIGSDVDDAFALALVIASPELDLRAVTTVGGDAEDRAWLVCRFLTQVGHKPIPIAFGRDPQSDSKLDWQIQYRRHPAAIFNRTMKPAKESAVELLYAQLKANPGELTIICLGPLTNVARLLKEHPDAKPWIKRLVVMGGAVRVGYKGKEPHEPEWNVKSDVAAAKAVFASGVPLTVAPLDATARVELGKDLRDRLFSAHTMLTFQVQNLYELWDKETPVLYDPVAVALTFDERFCKMEEMRLDVDDKGLTVPGKGKANARVAVSTKETDFTKWYVERVRAVGKEALPQPPKNASKLIERGGFPTKVHAFEDYDTDIEKRWWMCGKAETKDVAPGGRCCRAVLTQDFDDRQGDMKTMYRAVIFNPVPGPPMGKNTRLSFRYKLQGTDTIRVQLYSLTNGYHRYLSVGGLAQDRWADGAVDMTQMRRPDGSGGALGEDERIDDIQFYVDPRAELLIDDVVLYDAAAPGEKRPFPQRFLFTGWFDTGKQGKEWPGDFEIVPHEKPRTWKAARSVANAETGEPWIRLSLRGERRLGETTELFFRYRLTGADALRVELASTSTKLELKRELKDLKKGEWAEATLSFPSPEPKKELHVNEIRFRLPKGAELWIDDVLLYVPGEPRR
jgi:inosine-uridine nucleoside N-ribohydrolase